MIIRYDRSAGDPNPNDVLPLIWALVENTDDLLRIKGVFPVIWTLTDDGTTVTFTPHIPGDCKPEAAEAHKLCMDARDSALRPPKPNQ